MKDEERVGKPPYTNRGVTGGAERHPPQQDGSPASPSIEPLAISAGVDWLTCTAYEDEIGWQWYQLFLQRAGRDDLREWRNKWYVGRAANNLRWGQSSKQGYIFIVSGPEAERLFRQLVPTARNVSRVDLQVTVELPQPMPTLAVDAYQMRCKCKQRKYSLIQNTKGGQTLYVGSRKSSQFGRLYDKGVESGQMDAGLMWRYEVEYKPPRSGPLSRRLVMEAEEPGALSGAIIPTIYDWFEGRYIQPIFDRSDLDGLVVEIGRRVTSDDKKVEWLTTQVRPTIQDFLARGLEDKIRKALGLPEDFPIEDGKFGQE